MCAQRFGGGDANRDLQQGVGWTKKRGSRNGQGIFHRTNKIDSFVEEEKHIEKDVIRGLVLYLFTWVVKSGIIWFKEGDLNSKDQKVSFTIKHKSK